jgi:adenylate kinase
MTKNKLYETILLFGPPGAGKGTQGKILGTIPGFFHLSCGEVFRRINVNSELGKVVFDYTSRGELVPDEITIKLWKDDLYAQTVLSDYKPNVDLLILDGIPRNLNQARLLEKYLNVLRVVYLVCEDEEAMITRLRRRALKENRADDAREDVIRHRWKVYQEETQPVIDYYSQNLIRIVDALGSPAEVLRRILEIVVPVQNDHFSHAFDLDQSDGNNK